MRALALTLALLAPALAGCTLVPDPKPTDLSGPVDGYDPTASYLKVHVRDGDRLVMVDFDRRDWNVAGLAKLIDDKVVRNLTIHGTPREVLNEVLVETVADPSQVAQHRWNDQTSPQERSAADKAYDELVAKAHPAGVSVPANATPAIPLPAVPRP